MTDTGAGLSLLGIVRRASPPEPWLEGDNIPWHEPGFSQRMLKEHLSQAHDAASRRFETIDRHVHWIHHHLLEGHPTRILDLGCGPGLYTSRLAQLGHECVGIDYSPASIAYAVAQAEREHLDCTYVLQDMRRADYGVGFGLVMLIFGEFNVFRPGDGRAILHKANEALIRGGLVLLEAHTFSAVQRLGEEGPSWYSAATGLFSERPHLCLEESAWQAELRVATIRYFIVDATTGRVARYAQSLQAYTDQDYAAVLDKSGFSDVRLYPSLSGDRPERENDLLVIVGRKQDSP
jgi:SAM-dependent methyltransferase